MAIGQRLLTYSSHHTWRLPLPNPYLHAAVVGGIAVQIAAGAVPGAASVLGRADLPLALWGLVFAMPGLAWLVSEMWARALWGTRPEPLTAARRPPVVTNAWRIVVP